MLRSTSVFLIAFASLAGIGSAQVDSATATIEGTIFDQQGQVVERARILIVNTAKGVVSSATSTPEGYHISSLAPGVYRVEVEAEGFATSVLKDVVLTVGQRLTCDVHLKLGAQSTTIEVKADIPPLKPNETQQANIINQRQVENLPNVARNFVQSVYTIPGVINSFTPTLQHPGVGTAFLSSGFSIGGSNGRNNLVTIDGGENDYGSGALRENHVPIDSIQEFQTNRNSFAAEFGFTLGTAINMVTKSGTNQFHGSAAAWFRGRATDAENFFDKLNLPGDKPFEQSAIFSATLGGPIRKNLFFFTAPEYQKLDSATVRNLAGREELQGIASQANGYDAATGLCPNEKTPQQQVTQVCYLTQMAKSAGPASTIGAALLASPVFGNPLANPILNALVTQNDGTFDGIPASPVGSGVRGLPGFSTPRGRYLNWVTRLDYLPGGRDSLSLRFSLMRETDNVLPPPPYSGSEFQTDYTVTGSWTRSFTPNISNMFRAQAVPRNTATVTAPAPNGSEIDLGNQIQLGTPFSYPYFARFRRFQLDDGISWVKGNHLFKFGGSWRPDYYNIREDIWFGGQWKFTDGTFSILNIVAAAQGTPAAAALEDYNISRNYPATGLASTNLTAVQAFLAGLPTTLLQADPMSDSQWAGWAHSVGLYAQDSWKAWRGLSLNYGIRLDYSHDPSPVPHSLWLAPRVGLAWQPFGDNRTVIRAGGGIFVAPNVFMIPFYANTLGDSGRYINQSALVPGLPPPFPSIFAAWAIQQADATPAEPNPPLTGAQLSSLGMTIGPPGPAAFGNFIYTMAPNFRNAYSIQASASVARELSRNLTLEAAYLMYRSVHVEQVLEVNFVRNTAVPVDPFNGPSYAPRPGATAGEPNASIFQNNAFSSVGSGIYNGGTLSLTRRFDRGLQFQVNYSLSRAIDDTSDFSSLSTPFRPDLLNLDRAQSDFNITHNLVANAVYTTPFRAGSGRLLTRILEDVTISPIFYARSGVPFTLLVPGLSNGTIGHNDNARPWYEGRNNGIGPRFISWDLRISKTLLHGERFARLDLIGQAQNLLNRTNFAAVNNNFPVDPNYPLPGGGALGAGPYNVDGFVPASVAQLSQPLSFTSAYPARQISVALRFAF